MKILICGSRNYTNWAKILNYVKSLPKDTVIIEGEAKGADTLARLAAEECGLKVERYPANWNEYGKAAGQIRNRQMLNEGKPDLVVAFSDDLDNSKGTKNMVSIAKSAGIPVFINPVIYEV